MRTNYLVAIFLVFFLANSAFAQSSQACLSWMIWKEARGEGILTQRAVMDVAFNRMRASHKGICDVLRAEGQYPYSVDGVGIVPKEFLTRVKMLHMMEPVVSNKTFYFNDVPHKWAEKPLRIGHLFFY